MEMLKLLKLWTGEQLHWSYDNLLMMQSEHMLSSPHGVEHLQGHFIHSKSSLVLPTYMLALLND